MNRLLVLLVLVGVPLSAQEKRGSVVYDVLLKNGHVLDPASGREGRFDVGIAGGKVDRIAPDLPAEAARVVVDVGGCYVTPGLIDINAHVDAQGGWRSVNPDPHALRSGVTTVVDGGSTGWKNFEAFKTRAVEHARVRVLAFLNVAAEGAGGGEIDMEKTAQVAERYPNLIVGIRTPLEDAADWSGLDAARRAAERTRLVLMTDFHAAPRGDFGDLLARQRPGDIVTSLYGLGSQIIDDAKKVKPSLVEARKRGILFDLGHGSDGFWFRIAVPALAQGFRPDTVSTAMEKESVLLARTNMAVTLSKLLNLGVPFAELVERATVRAAKAIRRPELGVLSEGRVADIAAFAIERGQFGFLDSGHAKLFGDENVRAVLTVRAGQIVWDPDGRSRPDWITAGPYSNYR